MNWKRVRQRLCDFLGDHCPSDRLNQWVDQLGRSESGHHLGACVLIDIEARTVHPRVFAMVLENVDLDATDPVTEFGQTVDRLEKKDDVPTWQSRLSEDEEYTPKECARVLELGQFIRYCLPHKAEIMAAERLRTIRMRYFSGPPGRKLQGVNRQLSGNRGRIWIVPWQDLKQLRDEYAEKSGTVIRNALGLPFKDGIGTKGRPELVALLYPSPPKVRSAQPCTLDADWSQSIRCYFLPHKSSSGWGKTHSCSGQGPTCRERVHAEFDGFGSDFRGVHIGVAHNVDEDNWDAVLEEAERRLSDIDMPDPK